MKKILIVDDSETLRTQLKRILTSANFEVLEAENGVYGLQQLTSNPDISLIICDVNMPEMDGLTMVEKMSADTSINKSPIFMLTTESSQDMKVRGKAAGVMAWVTKPFVEEKLLKAVEKVANGRIPSWPPFLLSCLLAVGRHLVLLDIQQFDRFGHLLRA